MKVDFETFDLKEYSVNQINKMKIEIIPTNNLSVEDISKGLFRWN